MSFASLQRAQRLGRYLCLLCWASFAAFVAASEPVRRFFGELARLLSAALSR